MRSGLILQRLRSQRVYTTIVGLPFKIAAAEAEASAAKKRSIFAVNESATHSVTESVNHSSQLHACFMPFYTANIKNITATYVADVGKYRTETYMENETIDGKSEVVVRTRTVTDWTIKSGTLPLTSYPIGTTFTQIYADFNYDREIVESACQTVDVNKTVPITQEMINLADEKRTVYPHEMNQLFVEEKLATKIKQLEQARAETYILNAFHGDVVNITSLTISKRHATIDLFSYHVAAYVFTQHMGKYTSVTVVNGFNGQFKGQHILSASKTSAFGGIMGGIAGFALGLAAPVSLPAQILVRVALGSSLSAFFSALYARWHNATLGRGLQISQQEAEDNKRYPQSKSDIDTRSAAKKANEGPTYVYDKQLKKPVLEAEVVEANHASTVAAREEPVIMPTSSLPEAPCKVLGLDPNNNLTYQDVEKAYNTQLARQHAGLFSSESAKRRADENLRNMSAARDELGKILRANRHT